jgi:hypothetical protein
MPWKRLGMIFVPDGSKAWARSHAALPIPVQIGRDIFRFFFSTRDAENRSHVGWIDVDLAGSPRVFRESSDPVLAPGEPGTFDDSGVGIGSLVQVNEGVRLYYMGWNLGVRAPWRNAIGFAYARTPLDKFERFSAGPILDRSPEDPFTLSYPAVLRRSPHEWWMWYGSNLAANAVSADMKHAIKAARSRDGISWERDGTTVVGFADHTEYAIARPSVTLIGELFLMTFACRGDHYQVGAATSSDGKCWKRIDSAMGLSPSLQGWDSQMTCYPSLFWHRERLWLAYNGNGYGATGFGLAFWEGEYPFSLS